MKNRNGYGRLRAAARCCGERAAQRQGAILEARRAIPAAQRRITDCLAMARHYERAAVRTIIAQPPGWQHLRQMCEERAEQERRRARQAAVACGVAMPVIDWMGGAE